MREGYSPSRINWDYLRDREAESDGVLEPWFLSQQKIVLKPEWHTVLYYLDFIDQAFDGRLSAMLHSLQGPQTCSFSGAEIRVCSSAGRTLATFVFTTGEWLTMIAGELERNDFRFQGCYFGGGEGDLKLGKVLELVRSFAECATAEAFLEDRTLRIA